MIKRSRILAIAASLAVMVLVSSCGEAPRFPMSADAKMSDMYWFYAMYDENYAPLEYKEQRYGFKFNDLKAKYLAEAQSTKSNEEFYGVVYKFVAEFRDAHNSASITTTDLPGRAKVAYLGFKGNRQGSKLRVTEFLPTYKSDNFPVKAGDLITKINGVALADVVKNEMAKYRDLGQDEANLTLHMPRIFTRVSYVNGLPTGEYANLTIMRGTEELQVVLPWVVDDLYAFKRKQAAAAAAKNKAKPKDGNSSEDQLLAVFKMGFFDFNGKFEMNSTIFEKINRAIKSKFDWHNTFRFVDDAPTWMMELQKLAGEEQPTPKGSPLEGLAKERKVPADADPIITSKVYPAYTVLQKVVDASGTATGEEKTITYLRVDTFSPEADPDYVIKELKTLLKTMKNRRSKDLVIDLIDNGGGSLVLGLQMAQALSSQKVMMPEMQFRLSNSWVTTFETEASEESTTTPTERTMNGKVFEKLLEDRAAGLRLSRKFSTETLMSFPEDTNKELKEKLNIVLLVNEMCASMCDIFTAVLKDNQMATVVGTRTMGAGGNVVNYAEAPISKMQVRQTESLILRGDGVTYLENNGVAPDIEMAVSEDEAAQYSAVRTKAFTMLSTMATKTAPVEKAPVVPVPVAATAAQ